MLDISKAFFESDGDSMRVTMPIAKVDQEKRIVSGFATLDNVDRHGDIITADASKKAFSNFRGNVRLMHQPVPAGKLVSFKEQSYYDPQTGKNFNGIFVDAYISKGAQDIWEMVLDGTLTAFSIGGRVKKFDTVFDKEEDSSVRVITDYDLQELSLVDSPANQFANIFSVQKTDSGLVADGIFNKSVIQNVFWCENDSKAVLSQNEDASDCAFCNKSMTQIGWIDTTDNDDITKSISGIVNAYFTKAEQNVVTNDDTINRYPEQGMPSAIKRFVQWGSSGGTARGKIIRVVRRGKVKVPGSSFTLNASEEEPVALIRIYRKDSEGKWKPTDKVVGHKVKTLRSWATKLFKNQDLLQDEIVVDEASEIVADQINEGGVEVADNLEEVEVAKSDTEEVEEITVDEIVDSVAEEAVDVTKSDEPAEESQVAAEEVEKAEDASSNGGSDADELSKSIKELNELVKSVVEDGVKSNAQAVVTLTDTVAEFVKSTTASLEDINKSKEEINKGLAEIREVINHVHSRVEALEEDTAVKKSEDFYQSSEETSTIKKSLWGGRFLGTQDIF
jgi:HK97 family phage prohead protease